MLHERDDMHNIRSKMNALVLLNLLNKLRKKDQM